MSADFLDERACGAYIAAVCRPDATYAFSTPSKITTRSVTTSTLHKSIREMLATVDKGLKYVPLDLNSLIMDVFVDAGFGTNKDSSSQLGFRIKLMDKQGYGNIIEYRRRKTKRITRSVLDAELFAMVHGFDVAATNRLTLNAMIDRLIPLHVYTDSRSLYDCLTRINQTTEKRLLIYLRMLRHSYERSEITKVFWIPTAQNPADAFFEATSTPALECFLEKNHFQLTPNAWVDRETPSWGKASQPCLSEKCTIFEDGGVSISLQRSCTQTRRKSQMG